MASFPRKNLIFGDRSMVVVLLKVNNRVKPLSSFAVLLLSFSSRKLIWMVSGAIADIAEDCTGLIEKMIIKKLGLKPRP
ncbi:MAG: hypothetical protein EAZ23_12530 [Oscillatoriales cyanobacterium]|nr:MAG: hypothetical protein EAZ23_12530 [Oscillatoriales cyanobacterium]